MLPTLHDAEYWRTRASEVRAQAQQMSSPEARRQLLEIAAAYEKLAKLAEGTKST